MGKFRGSVIVKGGFSQRLFVKILEVTELVEVVVVSAVLAVM